MDSTDVLIEKVRAWGIQKGLTGRDGKATIAGQTEKLAEEFGELIKALLDFDEPAARDAIGDMTVVLILLNDLINREDISEKKSFNECLSDVYGIISKRTGRMEGGVFVKDK